MQGMWLMVGSLAIFFFASMLLYVVYIALRIGGQSELDEPFIVPRIFWVSTFLLLAISALLHWSIRAAARDLQVDVIIRTGAALIAAVGFLAIQTDAMVYLVSETKSLDDQVTSTSPYPLTLILALLHALHVVAGVIGLAVVVVNTLRQKYDHENHVGIKLCALYWHFLDIVWLVMLASFYIASEIFNAA